MITRERTGAILKLALPITVGLGSSFLMVFVDLAMVGTLGDVAVAAIGLAGVCHTLVIGFVVISPAVQGIVARRRGEGSREPQCLPLNGGLLLALASGILLSVFCYALAPFFFPLISSDPDVTREGVPFLRALFTAIMAIGMNSAFEGHWSGIGRVKIYMLVALFTNCVNIVLNYILIFGKLGLPAMGTLGAGIASAISMYTGTLIYFSIAFIRFRNEGFLRARPDAELLKRLFRLALPAALQQIFFSAGSIVLFWMYGQLGTSELAAATILVRVTMVMLLFAMALGQASATLVSSTLGQGDPVGAAQWGWDTGKIGVIVITLLGLPLLLFPEEFLGLFLFDPYTISIAVVPLQLNAVTTGIIGLSFIFAATLFSVGDGSRVTIVSFGLRWFFFIPAVWIIGPYLNYGLLEVWFVQIAYGFILVAVLTALWSDGRWKKIKL